MDQYSYDFIVDKNSVYILLIVRLMLDIDLSQWIYLFKFNVVRDNCG